MQPRQELADMIFMCGRVIGNGRMAARLYEMAFSDRRHLSHPTTVTVCRRVAERRICSKTDGGIPGVASTLDHEE